MSNNHHFKRAIDASRFDKSLTVKEYAKKYYLAERTVRRQIERGFLQGFKLAGLWYVYQPKNTQ